MTDTVKLSKAQQKVYQAVLAAGSNGYIGTAKEVNTINSLRKLGLIVSRAVNSDGTGNWANFAV